MRLAEKSIIIHRQIIAWFSRDTFLAVSKTITEGLDTTF
jgi:hypothetical protein